MGNPLQYALLFLVALSPLLAAIDAKSTDAGDWPAGEDSRRNWVLALIVSFFLPPLGPLLASLYILVRIRSSRPGVVP